MKTYTQFLPGCMVMGLLMLAPILGLSQHYANLTPESDNSPKKIKKSIISFGFFSPLNHHISIGYDQLIGNNLILSSQVGLIGPGVTTTTPATGGFIEVGPKLFFSPDWLMDGMHRYNAQQGGYFKPEIALSVFSQPTSYYSYPGPVTTSNQTFTGVALILNFGKQWILANSFALDMYVGIGYSINTQSTSAYNYNEGPTNYFSYITTGSSFPLAFSGGINLGVPF